MAKLPTPQSTMPTYSDPDSLDELALRAGADIRSPLLWTLVDLYLQKPKHTAEEAQHFTELTLRLLDEADSATRAAVARRLAPYPSVPNAIMRRLARDVPDRAAPARPASAAAKPREQIRPTQARVSAGELCDLFFAASAADRRLILLNLGYAPRPAAAPFARHAHVAAREFETAALAHNPDAFVRALERWLGITPALARRIVHDPLGEPIVVIAKAFGMGPEALQRILLFLNPAIGRSVHRVYELAALFESVDLKAALVLIGIWRSAAPRPITKSAASAQSDPAERNARRASTTPATVPQRDSAGASPRTAGAKR
jgi:uncharacterized protein (DUF2336 family)